MRISKILLLLGWVFFLGFLLIFGVAGSGRETQMILATVILFSLLVLRFFYKGLFVRILFLSLASYLSVSYFYWRTTTTLEFYDWISFIVAILLFLAEAYGFLLYLMSVCVNANPLNRKPVPLPRDPAKIPSVDVLVPSYNEPASILEVTLLAALEIRYPKDKLQVYLLDDGGTDQFCGHRDPDKAASAKRRRAELQALCQRVGARYLTRPRNEHAKAGNLNNGLAHGSGELVLVLDADHVPTRDILEMTVGWFVRDPKMFLVQTPHFFVNPDPVEKNLRTFGYMPGENEMFYKVIQKGLDSWNGAFFCGSAAILRRSCLDEVGGFRGDSITEDAETALALHAAGYNSAYIERPMISGLAPESLDGFIQQRIRWAQGMVQIFLLKNPMIIRGLTFPQRLCYTSSCFFWFFPFARLAFILAPCAFLLFGLKIYSATAMGFFIYAVPHVFAVLLASDYLFGRVRWLFVSEVYELIQSIHTLPAILGTLIRPRAPVFKVTAKGETLERDHISAQTFPFYLLLGANLIALIAGGTRIYADPSELEAAMVTMGWATFNSVLLLACLGVMLERRQLRATPRMPISRRCTLTLRGETFPAFLAEVSNGGARVALPGFCDYLMEPGEEAVLSVAPEEAQPPADFHVQLRNSRWSGSRLWAGLQFHHQSVEETRRKVVLVNGDSRRWIRFQQSREKHMGITGSLLFVAWVGLRSTCAHLWALFTSSGKPPAERSDSGTGGSDTFSKEEMRLLDDQAGRYETGRRGEFAYQKEQPVSSGGGSVVGRSRHGLFLLALGAGALISLLAPQTGSAQEAPERARGPTESAPLRMEALSPGVLALEDFPDLLREIDWEEAVFHFCMPEARPLRDIHLEWGAMVAQGLALELGDAPVAVTQSHALRRGRHNVVMGTSIELHPFLEAVNMVPLQGPFISVHPLPGEPAFFLVILGGRTESQVSDAVAAFARLQLPTISSNFARLDEGLLFSLRAGEAIPRPGSLRLPDLSILSQSGLPLSANRGGGLSVRVLDREGPVVAAAWTLLMQVARSSEGILDRADYAFGLGESDRDMLVVGLVDSLPSSITAGVLEASSEASWSQWLRRRLGDGFPGGRGLVHPMQLLEEEFTFSQSSILQYESPFREGRSITLLTARRPEIMQGGARTLQQNGLWYQLRGDFNSWLPFRPATLTTHRVGGTFPETRRSVTVEIFRIWSERLAERPWVLGVYVLLVLFLFSWTTRLLLGQRRRQEEDTRSA